MKLRFGILLFFVLTGLIQQSCFYRIKCDESKSVKIGDIEYSAKFARMELHRSDQELHFESNSGSLTFKRNDNSHNEIRRLNDEKICEEIDIKPTSAYKYYEYPNWGCSFIDGPGIISIDPEMEKLDDKRGESLYLTFSSGNSSLKARVPVSNIDTSITYQPFGELFQFKNSIDLDDREFENIWVFRKGKTAMYYSESLGIVALEENEKIYWRTN